MARPELLETVPERAQLLLGRLVERFAGDRRCGAAAQGSRRALDVARELVRLLRDLGRVGMLLAGIGGQIVALAPAIAPQQERDRTTANAVVVHLRGTVQAGREELGLNRPKVWD